MDTNSTNPTNLKRGYPIALLAAAILATTAILIRYLTQNFHIPPLVLAFWRDFFVSLTLLPVLGLLRPGLLLVKGRHLFYLALYGLALAFFNILWTLSVAQNGAAIATVLAYSSTAFTVLLGWRLLGEGLGWAKLLAVGISLTGCVLVADALNLDAWRANPVGILTGVFSGLGYAIYSLMGRSAARRGLNPWTTVFYTFSFAALFLLLLNLLPGGLIIGTAAHPAELFWLGDALVGWGILFLLAAGPTVAGFGLYNVSLGYLPGSVANLVVTLEPVFTAAIAYVLFGERLSGVQITGSLLILGGVVLVGMYAGRARLGPELDSGTGGRFEPTGEPAR